LNIRGIESGHVGLKASNTIQTEARASIDFRLVPDETPDSIKPLVERHIEAQGYTIVRETPDEAMRLKSSKIARGRMGAPAIHRRGTSLDLPLSREVAGLMAAAGHEPVRLPTVGGSIPMYLFQQPNDTPVIGLPIANHDDNQHSADENLRLQNLWDGIEIYAALFSRFGRRPAIGLIGPIEPMAGVGPELEASAGHSFTEAALGEKILLETTQLLVEQVVGLVNETDEMLATISGGRVSR
jgi:acetylornithine deacetylase/succinyl-diaminopimelate desuccinylase-like protein